MVREKYGEIAQNPPHFPGRHFTGVKPFNFRFETFVSDVNFLIRDIISKFRNNKFRNNKFRNNKQV